MLEVRNLSAGYNSADVIRNISFTVHKGESLCVLGPNGCGKSTLLKAIARIIDHRGAVLLSGDNSPNGIDIASLPRKELAKKIALLGQTAQVFFPYTVYETVSMGRYAHSQGLLSVLKDYPAGDKAIIQDVLKKLDLWDIKERMINELSGGTLQRVFLARTLAQTPDLILLDEPANHLDLKHQIELLDFLKSWVKENNTILIGVFHDLNLARNFGNTAILLNAHVNDPQTDTQTTIAAHGKIDNVLNSEVINEVYGTDIHGFMRKALEKWRD
ncbi:MAG: ABC transporter ATP-binding protein [Treponema sp.]|jgi:iron complex transport system ATP-binding protein|nr:ABC transporter ATP-binding protein [Treponema sp.]